jgi:hypothetical protein
MKEKDYLKRRKKRFYILFTIATSLTYASRAPCHEGMLKKTIQNTVLKWPKHTPILNDQNTPPVNGQKPKLI